MLLLDEVAGSIKNTTSIFFKKDPKYIIYLYIVSGIRFAQTCTLFPVQKGILMIHAKALCQS